LPVREFHCRRRGHPQSNGVSVCLRLHRATVDHTLVYSDHAIPNPDDFDGDDETKDSSAGYEWWASSMLHFAGKNHTSLIVKNLMAGGHDHIGSWLPDLSLPARRFLVFYDICAIEELLVRREPCEGSIPPGWRTKATDRGNWSPPPGSTRLIRVRAVRKSTWLSQTCSAREGTLAKLRVFAEFSRRSPLRESRCTNCTRPNTSG
jgi:hypothetical protein